MRRYNLFWVMIFMLPVSVALAIQPAYADEDKGHDDEQVVVVGPQGPIGLTGATGPAGPKGVDGISVVGPAGPMGLAGPQGSPGVSFPPHPPVIVSGQNTIKVLCPAGTHPIGGGVDCSTIMSKFSGGQTMIVKSVPQDWPPSERGWSGECGLPFEAPGIALSIWAICQ